LNNREDPNYISVDDNLYLIADISKTNPYVNEPITVVYKLYFSNNIGINNLSEVNKQNTMILSQNIDIKKLVEECLKARIIVIVLKKQFYTLKKSGKLTIEPLSMDVDVQLPTNRRDVFGRVVIVDDVKSFCRC
jgi:hypothetical protein